MSTTYPASTDNLTNPQPSDKLNNPSHSAQHANANDAIEAIEGYLGTEDDQSGNTITGRVFQLEAGGGGGTGDMTLDTDQTVTGTKTFQAPLLFDNNATVDLGTIQMVVDITVVQGDVFRFSSPAPIGLVTPSVFMNSSQVGYKVAGAQAGSLMVVAGIDAEGYALLGYQAPIPPAYSVSDTTIVPVVIKAAGVTPPTGWVNLGLDVVIAQDMPAGTANIAFEGVFTNPTSRTGTVEFGMRVNGTDLFREIKVQIGANYNQTIAMSIPLVNGYSTGDAIILIARVTDNNNNQFALTMANSSVDIGTMRIYQVGGGGGGAGGDADSVDGWSVAVVTTMPGSPDPNTIYFVQGPSGSGGAVAWADVTGTPTTLAGYGIANAYTKTEVDSALNGKLGAGANAVSATLAATVDDTNSANNLSFWYGTEAQFTAIPTKDPNTLYFRSA